MKTAKLLAREKKESAETKRVRKERLEVELKMRAEIQRDDEAAIFNNDRAARKHVERQEAHGSILHRKALICLGLALAQSRKTNKGWASAALRSAAKGGPSTMKIKPQAAPRGSSALRAFGGTP